MGYDSSSGYETKLNSGAFETMPGDANAEVGSRRSLLINSTSIFVGRIVTICVSLICVPIVIKNLGVVGFGTWESILAISILSNIFQSTISGTLLWKISQAHGARDLDSIQQYVRMGIFFSLILFITIAPMAWVGRNFIIDSFQIPQNLKPSASIILPSVVALMLLGTINEVLSTLLAGFQRAGLTTLIQAVSTTSNNVLVILSLFSGFGLWSLLIGFAMGFTVSAITLYLLAKQNVMQLKISPMIPTRAALAGLAPYAGFMLLHSFSSVLRDQTDKVILSSVASPLWTGYFGIAARLAGVVPLISSFFYVPTIAAAGALSGLGDSRQIHRLYVDTMTMTSFLVGLTVVLIGGFHDRILLLWIGKAMPDVSLLLYLLLGGYGFAVIMTGAGTAVCKGTGYIKMEATYLAAGLLMNIGLKLVLVPLTGPIGAVASSSISWVLSASVFVLLMHRRTDLPLYGTMKGLKTVLIVTVLIAFGRLASEGLPLAKRELPGLLNLAILSGLTSCVYCLLMAWTKVLPAKGLFEKLIRRRR